MQKIKYIQYLKHQLTLLFATLLSLMGYSQPDLTLNSGTVTNPNLKTGDVLNLKLNVKNQGSAIAGENHIGIYISPTISFTNANLLSEISLEALTSGSSDTTIQFAYPVPYNCSPGTNYVLIAINNLKADNVVETDTTNNNSALTPILTISSAKGAVQKLPYPIIFIHGLTTSDSATWYPLMTALQNDYGWTYGGRMDFCLNYDNNLKTSNLLTDYKDLTNLSKLQPGDFYSMNFNINPDGTKIYTNTCESDESAVAKQGLAVKDAITHVLSKSGQDKVILVTHSMGGLAARAYLEKPSIWQPDSQHHVAKFDAVAAPNGGSNASSGNAILDIFLSKVDEMSEAVRDLRTTYPTTLDSGVYLFGKNENEISLTSFYNNDVNCNGISGDSITGINQIKLKLPTDLRYTCLIGVGSVLPGGGDGVVTEYSAYLPNFKKVTADTICMNDPSLFDVLHTLESKMIPKMLQGMDEPGESTNGLNAISYVVALNQMYFGLITTQSKGNPSPDNTMDYDTYQINITQKGKLTINILDIPIARYTVEIIGASNNLIAIAASNGKSNIDTSINISPGTYFCKLYGHPISPYAGTKYPQYAFAFNFQSTTGINEIKENNFFQSKNYPNPFSGSTTLSFVLPVTASTSIKLFDIYGSLISVISNNEMKEGPHQITLDGTTLKEGMYFYTIESENTTERHKLIHQR